MKLRRLALLTAALGLTAGPALAQEITLKVHHFLPPSSNAPYNIPAARKSRTDLRPCRRVGSR